VDRVEAFGGIAEDHLWFALTGAAPASHRGPGPAAVRAGDRQADQRLLVDTFFGVARSRRRCRPETGWRRVDGTAAAAGPRRHSVPAMDMNLATMLTPFALCLTVLALMELGKRRH